jgi:3-hydroxyisobutyrate dehydrogenase-like beta-hydroxyacid dehydrogenase
MGKNITLVGGNGDGQTTKVANQTIVALTIEAVGDRRQVDRAADDLGARLFGLHECAP